ncbi:hypothetical protein GC175_21060 [bacterium]|nr:hypothetical protein [bacterium]
MAVIHIEIPEKLWIRLQNTGRPVEELVVEALEKSLEESPATKSQEPSEQEILQRLSEAGYLSDPKVWDGPDARSWRDLPEVEKQRYIQEMESVWLPDSAASRLILESRR